MNLEAQPVNEQANRCSNERRLLKQTADLLREMREDIFQRGTLSGRSQRAGDDLLRRIDTILITPDETTVILAGDVAKRIREWHDGLHYYETCADWRQEGMPTAPGLIASAIRDDMRRVLISMPRRLLGEADGTSPIPTAVDVIETHVRQIQILCDATGRDPTEWLSFPEEPI